MSPKQQGMCFAEWKKCWFAIVQASGGRVTADEREVRHAVTFKAIGKLKSWGGAWSQDEVDALLAVMWAIAQPGNFDLQMRQQNQPLTRAEGSGYAQALLGAIGIEPHGREAYLDSIARRIFKKPLCEITDREWPAILGALNHTRQHKTGEVHSHPRSRWQPRRSGNTAAARPAGAGINPATARTGSVVPPGEGEDPF